MKTIIVGGGIAGIITALYENLAGHDVEIFEAKPKLGGRLAFHGRGEYRIDEGPTVVLLPQMITAILKELGLEDRIEMVRIDPLYPLHYPDGTSFLKWSNTEKQKQEINQKFPGEADAFDVYLSDMRRRFNEGQPAFLEKDFVKKKQFFTPANMKTLMRLKAYQSVRTQTKKYFKSRRLQEAFALQTLYIGGGPEQTPAIYSLVPYSEHEHGIWYVKGGYASMVEALAEALEERGVKVHTHANVSEVVTQGRKAEGIMVRNELYQADRIVLNGEFPLAEKLMPEKPKRTYTPSSGCLLFYFGLNKVLSTEHVHNFYMGENLDEHMNTLFAEHQLSDDPAFYVFNPSLIDKSLAPEGHGVAYVLVPVPSADHVTKEEYLNYAKKIKEMLLKKVDADLDNKLEWEHVRTPHEAQADGLFMGGSFGISPSLFQSGVFRPQIKPFSFDNVYAVGASVHPGGGIPVVMQGAKILSNLLRKEESDKFSSKNVNGSN